MEFWGWKKLSTFKIKIKKIKFFLTTGCSLRYEIKKMHFIGQKNLFLKPKFFFSYLWISKKKIMKDKNLCLKKPRTLGAWNRQFSSKGGWKGRGWISCSYAFLGICEAIFRGRYLIFCVETHISIYFTNIKSFFNMYNLEPAPGCPAPELEVKAPKIVKLDVLEQA